MALSVLPQKLIQHYKRTNYQKDIMTLSIFTFNTVPKDKGSTSIAKENGRQQQNHPLI